MADVQPSVAPNPAPAPTGNEHKNAVDQVIKTLPGDKTVIKPADPVDEVIDDVIDDPAAEKKAIAEEKKKWKLKVGNRDVEADEDELVKRAQMGYSADEKWQEAAKLKKQIETVIHALHGNPLQTLAEMGLNVDELAEQHLRTRIAEMQKTPEQLERDKMEKELAKLKKQVEDREKSSRELELSRLQEKYAVDIESDIMTALKSDAGMPNSPYVVKRITDAMISAMKSGYKDVTAKDVIPYVQDEIREELKNMYNVAPDDMFEQLVGKDRLTKYRKGKVKKPSEMKTAADVRSTGQREMNADKPSQEKPKVKTRDFFKKLGY